ncbi:bifunctional adenosylcobinamide kinase/adenosylcobinamide-phosphate guanylyltransferase [Halomonas elongata]|uniref:Bifunctional adenosylcobalamin biosynthesis protein n=1 Tax=Halomonas eurihalina TaxID=42566 RepID=A0A5D9D8W2_HALER|nr:bifunctional adenosylcobinamide kinase/adenosylcobinamide-phosphate guanylyltransferase [Halomonas eurihalina]MDR5859737.1 bifunctional adenosylcobinamide kinase/adenosylcobinamide-phosphate guanylyltransferase [Halomonas eurihalina]TZG39191.1 bifunctional adenosylcobinamide kinase/adenosylcobinamide-phosphate guanylyltransferase [Halomonas eurihalina]
MITFVSGGARSGKSAVAEQRVRVTSGARGVACYYLATARAGDAEMARRIDRHRRERGEGWITLEAPLDLPGALERVTPGSAVLLDCLTLWASQAMFEAGLDASEGRAMLARTLGEARRRALDLVVVSNDLNEDVPPRHAVARRYLAFLQALHRDLAREADRVIEVVAGQAIDWKGGDG